jgi:hypothetical protein
MAKMLEDRRQMIEAVHSLEVSEKVRLGKMTARNS